MEYAVALVAVTLAAWIQGSVGFGYALIAAPALALVAPQMIPGPIMLASTVLAVGASFRERHAIDRRGVTTMLVGRVPGTAVGAVVLASLSAESFGILFAGVVLLAVALSLSGWRVPMTTPNLLATGCVSGVMGTTTAIGGPPIALVYQDAEGPRLRSTLNTYFALGAGMSMVALALIGKFGRREMLDGVLLMPATVAGLWMSGATRSYLDQGRTRAAVLATATLAAVAVVLRELLR